MPNKLKKKEHDMLLAALALVATITVSSAFIMWKIDERINSRRYKTTVKLFKDFEDEYSIMIMTERQMKSKRKQAKFN